MLKGVLACAVMAAHRFVRPSPPRPDMVSRAAYSTLQSLNLPGSLQALEQPMGLPPSLLRKSDDVRLEGGLSRLHSMADNVSRIARTDASILIEARATLDQEAEEDAQVRASFSEQRWTRPGSEHAAADLRAQGEQYRQTLEAAAASDEIVRNKLEDWEDVIGVLAGGQVSARARAQSFFVLHAVRSSACKCDLLYTDRSGSVRPKPYSSFRSQFQQHPRRRCTRFPHLLAVPRTRRAGLTRRARISRRPARHSRRLSCRGSCALCVRRCPARGTSRSGVDSCWCARTDRDPGCPFRTTF